MKKIILGVIIAFVVMIGGCMALLGAAVDSVDEDTTAKVEQQVEEPKKETKKEEPKEEEPDVSMEFQNALKSAQTYSDMMHMSKAGIYDQLTSEYGEQFPEDAAQYAIDNVEADWKENALESARSYQKNMSMSRSAIYDQLVSEYGEQFTDEEAQYAIDNLEK